MLSDRRAYYSHVALAYLITFRTYGTWLHGDQRGSMERRQFNTPDEPRRPVSYALESWERARLRHPPRKLDKRDRPIVEGAIEELANRRAWQVAAMSVRAEHVHVVIAAEDRPDRVLIALKAAATRALRGEGRAPAGEQVWSRHGSTRYLWDERSLSDAVRYVVERQDVPKS